MKLYTFCLAALLASPAAHAAIMYVDAEPGITTTARWDGRDDISVRFFGFDSNPASYTVHLVTSGGTVPNGGWDLVFESAFADPHVMAPAQTPWDWDRVSDGWRLVQAFSDVGECQRCEFIRRTWEWDAASVPNNPPPAVTPIPAAGLLMPVGLAGLLWFRRKARR